MLNLMPLWSAFEFCSENCTAHRDRAYDLALRIKVLSCHLRIEPAATVDIDVVPAGRRPAHYGPLNDADAAHAHAGWDGVRMVAAEAEPIVNLGQSEIGTALQNP